MKAIIVDDDPRSHTILQGLIINAHPDIELVASGHSIEEGLTLIRTHRPELVFLDIELPDGLGFDLLPNVTEFQFYVIFITAHDKYAISAIRFGALDYLLKPFASADLAFSLKKARELQQKRISEEQLKITLEAWKKSKDQQLPSRQAIYSQTDIIYLKVKDIIRLEAQSVYTLFHLNTEKQPIVSTLNLGKYVEQFAPYLSFVQVHRSHIINLTFVHKYLKGDRIILMEDGSEIKLSRAFIADFKEGMDKI